MPRLKRAPRALASIVRLSALAALIILNLAPQLTAQADEERQELTGEHFGTQFLAGPEVRVEANVDGDLFAAGGKLVFGDTTAQDIFAAGGSLQFSGIAVEDLVVAGGELDIDGEIADGLVAAGGSLAFRSNSVVKGYAVMAGGDLNVEGQIDGDLKAAGGRIRISGHIKGDVDLAGGRIILASGTQIDGKLTYASSWEADIAPGAVVSGGIEQLERPPVGLSLIAGIGIAVAVWIVMVLGMGIAGGVLQLIIPECLIGAVRAIEHRPGLSFSLGFALLASFPIAGNLLFMTVIGIPLSVLIYTLYLALLIVSLAVLGYSLGLRFRRPSHSSEWLLPLRSRILLTLAGVAIVGLVALIPILGFIVVLIGLCFATGGLGREIWQRIRREAPASPWRIEQS
jgi:cytoskeletal protein CcmA (bactofilin family)